MEVNESAQRLNSTGSNLGYLFILGVFWGALLRLENASTKKPVTDTCRNWLEKESF